MKPVAIEKISKQFFSRKFAFLAVAFMAFANSACSTPPVPDTTAEDYEIAWWSYEACLRSLPRSAHPSSCDNVNSSRTLSRQQYVGGGYYGKAGSATNELYDKSYKTYLSTLEPDAVKAMTAEWLRLALEAEDVKR